MSPGPSPPSALHAALAGVSHPFATRRASRSAHTRQHAEQPPPPGTDSSYGVRSINSSVEWDARDDDHPSDASEQSSPSASDDAHDQDEDRVIAVLEQTGTMATAAAPSATLSASTGDTRTPTRVSAGLGSAVDSPPPAEPQADSQTAPPPMQRSLNETPTPQAMPLPMSTPSLAPERASMRTPSPSVAPRDRPQPPYPVATHTLLDMLADAPSASEPGSPASLASYPSCIASLSSLSRTSSPSDWDWRHPLSRSLVAGDLTSDDAQSFDGLGLGEPMQSAELVLPTLALPSTSLNLGLERWPGLPAGSRIALLASPEETRDVLGALATRQTCVQLAHGAVGVVKGGSLVATILTGHSVSNVHQRTTEAYTALHSLLNPSPTAEQRRELEPMVDSYSSRADWVHLVVNLDGSDCAELAKVVSVSTLEAESERLRAEAEKVLEQEAALAEAVEDAIEGSEEAVGPAEPPSPPSLPLHDVNDTPLATSDAGEFQFAQPPSHVPEDLASSETLAQGIQDAVDLIVRALDDPTRVQSASYTHFFNWRPGRTIPVDRSSLTTSPASSAFDGASSPAPLPTVTRASGEWEATLSRRLAHRRELDASARRSRQAPAPVDLGRRRRRRRTSHSPKPDNCTAGPLFPRRHISTAELGLSDLFSRVFAPVKDALARTTWTHMVFACAIAFAVGCGFWAARA